MKCEERPLLEFLDGRLNLEANPGLVDHLHCCPTCRERTRILVALLVLRGELSSSPRAATRRIRSAGVWFLAASLTALLLLGGLIWQSIQGPLPGPRRWATQQAYPYFPLETRDRNAGPQRRAAFLAYQRGDYSQAARLFRLLPADPEILFYRGVSLYLAGSVPESLLTLREPDLLDSPWRIPALWYQAHAWLRMGRADRARRLLSRAEFDSGPYAPQARILRNRLERSSR